MNVRWLWLDHIPPELGLTAEQRKKVRQHARSVRIAQPKLHNSHRIQIRGLLLTIVPLSLVFGIWLVVLLRMRLTGGWHALANLTGILLFNALLWLAITWMWFRTSRPFVRKALNDLGHPVCMHCGYALRGLNTDTICCPECGAPCSS